MELFERYFRELSVFMVPILYCLIAPAFYFQYYHRVKIDYESKKSQSDPVKPAQFRQELFFSFLTLIIFGFSGYFVHYLFQSGHTYIYMRLGLADIVYLPVSVFLMILFHDMYFYWTHRLLHLRGWYQNIHNVHHLSSNPSPFTSLSFHPVEAVIQAAVIPFMLIIIPAHPAAIILFLIYMVYQNVRGHSGYDFSTPAQRKSGWHRFKGYPVYHNLHHQISKDNYGLYFTIWDRLMRTFKEDV